MNGGGVDEMKWNYRPGMSADGKWAIFRPLRNLLSDENIVIKFSYLDTIVFSCCGT